MCKSTFSRMLSLSLFLLVLSPVPFVILPKISLDPSCLHRESRRSFSLPYSYARQTSDMIPFLLHIISSYHLSLVESNNKNKCWFQPSLCWSCEYRRSDWNSSKIENEPQTRDRSLHITLFQRSYRRWRFMWKLFPRSLICLLSAAAPTHRTCRVHRERV